MKPDFQLLTIAPTDKPRDKCRPLSQVTFRFNGSEYRVPCSIGPLRRYALFRKHVSESIGVELPYGLFTYDRFWQLVCLAKREGGAQ
jgi:hypothetical protein